MAILNQRIHEYMIINGWYGKCHADNGDLVNMNDCPDFDLLSETTLKQCTGFKTTWLYNLIPEEHRDTCKILLH